MKRTLTVLITALVLISLMITGCSSSTSTTPAATTTTATPTVTTPAEIDPSITASTTTPEPATITVTDMMGRSVTLPKEIKTIATFGSIGVLNAFVETMGSGDKIINQMSPSFTKTDQWKFQYVFAPQIANGPLFEDSSKEIQIETVLETAPDICLCMTKETCTLLEEKGLNVLYLEWKVGSDADKLIRLLGEALGKQELAEDYLTWYNDMVAKADGLTANIAQADKTTVLYGNVTSLTRPLDIVEWWVSKAGGISVTSDGGAASSAYTIEDLLGWNPEVIVTTNAAGAEQIKADERFEDIPAIVNNRIYKVPTVAHIWGQRTPEQPLTVMWMMNKLHPDILSTEALKEDIQYFYSHFFKTELTDAQLMEIIG